MSLCPDLDYTGDLRNSCSSPRIYKPDSLIFFLYWLFRVPFILLQHFFSAVFCILALELSTNS